MNKIRKGSIVDWAFLLFGGLILVSCGGSSSSGGFLGGGGSTAVPGEIAFVATTDFTTGSYSTINLRDLTANQDLPSQVGIIESDNWALYHNNKVYVINRFGFDNITVLDTADLSRAVTQFSTGNGTNPQDMAFVSDTKAYVSLLERSNDLLVVDPTAPPGAEITSTIDLSGFLDGDQDGFVEAGPMAMVGTTLFVALQRLDSFVASRPGVLAVIDTTTDTLFDVDPGTPGTQGIVLTGQNPAYMDYDANLGKIVVSEVGNFGVPDGGIETVDPRTFVAEGFMITENDLGDDVGDVIIVDGLKGYAVVGGFAGQGVTVFDVDVDPVTGVITGSNPGDLVTGLPFVPDLALDSAKRLLVPDRDLINPGIRIYDTFTDQEITTDPINVGLPPNAIVNLF